MIKYDLIFILVNYNTTNELEKFILTTNNNIDKDINYKCICIDNFSDDKNLKVLKELKIKYNFDLIENKNDGYGAGNNVGVEFALKKYNFEFLIISNCDIEIIELNILILKKYSDGIIAPDIINLKNKTQNPLYIKEHPFLFKLFNFSSKFNSLFLQKITIFLSKILFMIDGIFFKNNKIFACHGSFIIFPYSIIKKLHPVFDNKMFLLCEEILLALKAKNKKTPIYFIKKIKIKHFEDASMSSYDNEEKNFNLWKQSFDIFYNNYWIKC